MYEEKHKYSKDELRQCEIEDMWTEIYCAERDGLHDYAKECKEKLAKLLKTKLQEEYSEATETIQDLIDILKDTKKRLEKSTCPHAIAAGAWLEQSLNDNAS